jgi:hypothetical protein
MKAISCVNNLYYLLPQFHAISADFLHLRELASGEKRKFHHVASAICTMQMADNYWKVLYFNVL